MVKTNFFPTLELQNILLEFGQGVIYNRIVKTISNVDGEETLTSASGFPTILENIYVFRTSERFTFDVTGNIEGGDAQFIALLTTDLKRDDTLGFQGENFTITSIDGDATTIAVSTSTDHGLAVGDQVSTFNTTNYNGVFVVATVPSSTSFTIADTAHDFAAETSGQTVARWINFRIRDIFKIPGIFFEKENTTFTYHYGNLFVTEQT